MNNFKKSFNCRSFTTLNEKSKITITVFICLILVFITPDNAFAEVKKLDVQLDNQILKMNINQNSENTFAVRRNLEESGVSINSSNDSTWMLSILLPGIGQLLMGDISGGIIFIIIHLILIPATLFLFDISKPVGDNFGVILLPVAFISGLSLIIVYVCNIAEAYFFSQKQSTETEYIQIIKNISEKTRISGRDINFNVLSF